MNIVILDSGYSSYHFEKSLFEKNGFTLKIHPSYKGEKSEKMLFAREADGILVRHTPIDEDFLSEMKNLKALVRYGVGYDNVDVDACTRHGVKVANVQGYANHAVSEHALALLLACSRGMWDTRSQIANRFVAPPVKDIFELHDKTLGIIGLGRIGSTFGKKAVPLFRETIASDPYKPPNYFDSFGIKKVSLDKVLKESDIISIHCNLTSETTHLLNKDTFSKMKKKPVIINTARGEVVDEKALLKALEAGQIHSAGLDVYENEPVTKAQETLIHHPRTICTGHYAWYSDYAAEELQKRAARNLLHLLKGENVEDCLNP
ncbi:C-terminal binding protein [Mariniphaga sediminis]|uniref:C-terminal binding protein n=1 Tax=Mariniphaga sediminis TaxID=1628158 RepID=A0A399CVR2_9BACT|nr:C-terminal binding protein [Mariniphaga sediminis]RIH63088.1 C-terminal binding protein [Mariniphaga sediminis]